MHQNSMEQSNNFKHKGSNRSSPTLTIQNGTNPYLNNNNNHHHRQTHIPTPIPPSSSIQCSAYFIARLDLNNYMLHTLQQAVDSVVSGPKPIG